VTQLDATKCPRIRRTILPALALSGALALAGRAIQTSRDLGWLPNAVTIPATAVKGQDATG